MNKRSNKLNLILIILLVISLGVSAYFITEKKLSEDNNKSDKNDKHEVVDTNFRDDENDNIKNYEVNENTKLEVNNVLEKYLKEVFLSHSNNYCGNVDYSKKYKDNFYETSSYSNMTDVKNYFNVIVSDSYFEDNLKNKFVLYDDKVYCESKATSSLVYEENSFEIIDINSSSDNFIVKGKYTTLDSEISPKATFNISVELIYENDNLVVDSYSES